LIKAGLNGDPAQDQSSGEDGDDHVPAYDCERHTEVSGGFGPARFESLGEVNHHLNTVRNQNILFPESTVGVRVSGNP
jgi:hypothetical protein